MVVLADENFPRCPVSNEVFRTIWDEEEGDFMYRNAVRVLLTNDADPELYLVSRPTPVDNVRYALVHKRMALDGWLAAEKAITVNEAMILRKKKLRENIDNAFPDYAAAACVDEDESDVFVLMPDYHYPHPI